jgi:hypothetical protein
VMKLAKLPAETFEWIGRFGLTIDMVRMSRCEYRC